MVKAEPVRRRVVQRSFERLNAHLSDIMLRVDLRFPASSIVPGLRGRVLIVLASVQEPLSGREIARRSDGSQRGVGRILDELAAEGLVRRAEHPPATLHLLNHEHLAASVARALAGMRGELYKRIAEHATAWDPPAINVSVFGSYVRGDGGPDSDIDLLVVTPTTATPELWDRRLADLEAAVTSWTGNPARLLSYTAAELAHAERQGVRLVGELRREAVPAIGVSIAEVLAAAGPQ